MRKTNRVRAEYMRKSMQMLVWNGHTFRVDMEMLTFVFMAIQREWPNLIIDDVSGIPVLIDGDDLGDFLKSLEDRYFSMMNAALDMQGEMDMHVRRVVDAS